jgi:hypothetical protein
MDIKLDKINLLYGNILNIPFTIKFKHIFALNQNGMIVELLKQLLFKQINKWMLQDYFVNYNLFKWH